MWKNVIVELTTCFAWLEVGINEQLIQNFNGAKDGQMEQKENQDGKQRIVRQPDVTCQSALSKTEDVDNCIFNGPFDKGKSRPKSHFNANHEAAKCQKQHPSDSLQCDLIRKAREKLVATKELFLAKGQGKKMKSTLQIPICKQIHDQQSIGVPEQHQLVLFQGPNIRTKFASVYCKKDLDQRRRTLIIISSIFMFITGETGRSGALCRRDLHSLFNSMLIHSMYLVMNRVGWKFHVLIKRNRYHNWRTDDVELDVQATKRPPKAQTSTNFCLFVLFLVQ
ncbi:hypothetical protein RFI_01530 [Reticulomyxa filosa]|uniref:Uncharacterized protein n=1 Tax=Reticulomyxa filosa TaxID=46433 RepID=X6PBH1_RETFI|nr:hypothetical protein RFI_01530 [Reticulomyxa filosa]|eukprot:ETO35531.1 hypothetical protein RFI_01530 [Reticulomyxa filosa]